MESSVGFNIMKPYYYQQLEIVRYYLNTKKSSNAIELLSTLIEQLQEDIQIFNKMNTIDASKMLNICYAWREYYYFVWLIEDPDSFQQNKSSNSKGILLGYQEIMSNKTLSHLDEDEIKLIVRFNIVRLLFEEYLGQNILQYMRHYFCLGFDRFKQVKQLQYQALTLLGLALIAAYEGDSANAYQGLNFVKTLCPTLNKFIQMIYGEIAYILKRSGEKTNLIINPLLSSNHLASIPRP